MRFLLDNDEKTVLVVDAAGRTLAVLELREKKTAFITIGSLSIETTSAATLNHRLFRHAEIVFHGA